MGKKIYNNQLRVNRGGNMKSVNLYCFVVSLLTGMALGACSGGGNNVGTSASNPSSTAFPQGLTISSPLDTEEESILIRALTSGTAAATASETIEEEIAAVLEGDSLEDCGFDVQNILETPSDATCYGPTVDYENHPDYNPADPENSPDGELPPGDLGIWRETEDGTEACAAASLNARLNGIQQKTRTALMTFASMICVSNVKGVDLPENSSSDLTDEMNDMSVTNEMGIEFESVTLTHDNSSGKDEYSYNVSFSFTDPDGDSHDAILQMTHRPEADLVTSYTGRFSYAFDTTESTAGNCPSIEMTAAGSVLYDQGDESNKQVQAMDGTFCGFDADAVGSNGLVDPNDSYNATTNPDGWANNFTILIANMDEGGMGNYSMAWQAGYMDDKSRVFNIVLSQNDNSVREATAYFGFGAPVNDDDFDGSIDGFICNWAGPGQNEDFSHTPLDFMQRQTMVDDGAGGPFEPVTSDIAYAPTSDCEYAGGDFEYDLDGDGTIEIDETTDSADGIDNKLADLSELDFTLPTAPANF